MTKEKDPAKVRNAESLPDDDADLFRRSIADARPLAHDPTAPIPRRVAARAKFRADDESQVLRESLEAEPHDADVQSGAGLRFHRQHVGRQTMRKLARGNFSVQAEIDLHGMTVPEAAAVLRDFVNDCCLRDYGCIRVVHGKGMGSGQRGPVLKRKVDAWLRRWDQVLAFVSARQVDGGTGAVYVLLDPERGR